MKSVDEVVHKPWLRYWRNSLADSSSHHGVLTENDFLALKSIDRFAFRDGCLSTQDFDYLESLFKDESDSVQVIKVVLRPASYRAMLEHGQKQDAVLPDVITPLICEVWLGRDGRMVPAGPCSIPRDLLSPLADDEFTLSSVGELDRFLTEKKVPCYSENEALALLGSSEHMERERIWKRYYDLSRELFDSLCSSDLLNDLFLNLEKVHLTKVDVVSGAASNIIKLYDWLVKQEGDLPLLDNYAASNVAVHEPCMEPVKGMLVRLGHANSQHHLAVAQRDALAQALEMKEGDILAVNGPPGTGKTTFVLSVVASLWVRAALDETEPPLIVAASTNNQAVTNVLEAFSSGFEVTDDPLSRRWLPSVKSYGGYYVAKSGEAEASMVHQTPSFYRQIERPELFEQAESVFLSQAREALGDASLKSVGSVKKFVHQHLRQMYSQLENVQQSWHALQAAERHWCAISQSQEAPESLLAKEQAVLERLKLSYGVIDSDAKRWRRFLVKESVWWGIFSFISAVARKRDLRNEVFIDEHFSAETKALLEQKQVLNKVAYLDTVFLEWLNQQSELVRAQEVRLRELHDAWSKLQGLRLDCLQAWSLAVGRPVAELPGTFDALDQSLDISLRFKLFQWAQHYWEARWLEDCVQQEKDLIEQAKKGSEKTGLTKVKPRWRRRMKLTPCVVSTLHSLPSHMRHVEFESKGVFREAYLTREIDLLIIDEAGQVSPDVAGASIALAKRVLAIGDVKQIPPIPSVSEVVDVGNLLKHGVLQSGGQYKVLSRSGRLVVDGSVMKIAQQASRYHYLPEAESGMFLREHRRCLNEIISFCNDLCYQGVLQPMRDWPAKAPGLRPFSYVHVDGRVEALPSGSRINRLEAVTIAEWLVSQREHLEKAHQGKKLEEIVGVVTPFKAQAQQIRDACSKLGIAVGKGQREMTVGTVHALQGAERPVVIFSAVYSRHEDGGFIDRDPSLLNVAVSRAKDSFIVFGDMEVIGAATRGSPRHLLSKFLFETEANQLVFVASEARPDLLAYCPQPRLIQDAREHDECFAELLRTAQRRVAIVSPWVIFSRLKETGFLDRMQEAVGRGVQVELYVDQHFNTHKGNEWSQAKADLFVQGCQNLAQQGIFVYVIKQVHSKMLMGDEAVLCVGSFNWASAVRDQDSPYHNMETSIVYSGHLAGEINFQLERLRLQQIRVYPEQEFR
jgi:hypothetical protein